MDIVAYPMRIEFHNDRQIRPLYSLINVSNSGNAIEFLAVWKTFKKFFFFANMYTRKDF